MRPERARDPSLSSNVLGLASIEDAFSLGTLPGAALRWLLETILHPFGMLGAGFGKHQLELFERG
jgi:hypothetical protein